MSLLDIAKAKFLQDPNVRSGLVSVEGALLSVLESSINSILPQIVMGLAGGIVTAIEEKGKEYILQLSADELTKLAGNVTTVPIPPGIEIKNVADLMKYQGKALGFSQEMIESHAGNTVGK